jgi:hypothetical protein
MTLRETMLRDPEAAPVAADIPRRQGLAFMQLTRRTCRWPIGDPRKEDFCFRGATSVRDGRIASFIAGSRMRQRNEGNRGQARDRASTVP